MKGALLLTVILAGILAVHGNWQRNKVYKYEVKTKALKSSFQSRNEPAGLYYRVHLTLQPYSGDVIIGQITEAKFRKVNDNQNDSDSDEADFENSPLSKPFRINVRNDVIQSLGVDDSLSKFEVNQLKLIMNQFQVNTNGQNVNSFSENQPPQADSNTAFYKVTGSADTGRCETTYDISPISDYLVKSHPEWVPLPELKENSEDFVEIVKTKDSANCGEARNFIAAVSDDLKEEDVRENDWSIVEYQRIVVSGSMQRFTIQSALNQITTSSRNTPFITVYVNTTLESVESASERSIENWPDNLKIVENLTYDFNTKMEENQYEPQQSRQWHARFGGDPRYTACVLRFVPGNVACRAEFGIDWSFTGNTRNCDVWRLGKVFECRQ